MPVDGRRSADRGVSHAGCQLRRRESIGIGLLVDETQGIDALKAPIEFDPAAVSTSSEIRAAADSRK